MPNPNRRRSSTYNRERRVSFADGGYDARRNPVNNHEQDGNANSGAEYNRLRGAFRREWEDGGFRARSPVTNGGHSRQGGRSSEGNGHEQDQYAEYDHLHDVFRRDWEESQDRNPNPNEPRRQDSRHTRANNHEQRNNADSDAEYDHLHGVFRREWEESHDRNEPRRTTSPSALASFLAPYHPDFRFPDYITQHPRFNDALYFAAMNHTLTPGSPRAERNRASLREITDDMDRGRRQGNMGDGSHRQDSTVANQGSAGNVGHGGGGGGRYNNTFTDRQSCPQHAEYPPRIGPCTCGIGFGVLPQHAPVERRGETLPRRTEGRRRSSTTGGGVDEDRLSRVRRSGGTRRSSSGYADTVCVCDVM